MVICLSNRQRNKDLQMNEPTAPLGPFIAYANWHTALFIATAY